MASMKKQMIKKPSPVVPLALGAAVLAGIYFIARRSNPQLEAARRHEAAINAALGGGGDGRAPAGLIDLSKLTYGRLFVVGSETSPSDPFSGQYTVLTYNGVQNGAIRAKAMSGAKERDVPVSSITAIRGA